MGKDFLTAAQDILVGYTYALEIVHKALVKKTLCLADPNRPIVSILISGPTGCGKTTFAKSIAYGLHKDKSKILQINCAEYRQPHEVAKLIGAPPGYLGHRETMPVVSNGALRKVTSQYSQYSVVLFDEVEKGSQELMDLLLGVLEEGTLSLGNGETCYFNNCIIVFTTNLGVDKITTVNPIGFTENTLNPDQIENSIKTSIQKSLRWEFVNRLNKVLVFQPLSIDEIRKIAERNIRDVLRRAGLNYTISEGVIDKIVEDGYSTKYGAREINRVIDEYICDPLVELYDCHTGVLSESRLHFYIDNGKVSVKVESGTSSSILFHNGIKVRRDSESYNTVSRGG